MSLVRVFGSNRLEKVPMLFCLSCWLSSEYWEVFFLLPKWLCVTGWRSSFSRVLPPILPFLAFKPMWLLVLLPPWKTSLLLPVTYLLGVRFLALDISLFLLTLSFIGSSSSAEASFSSQLLHSSFASCSPAQSSGSSASSSSPWLHSFPSSWAQSSSSFSSSASSSSGFAPSSSG